MKYKEQQELVNDLRELADFYDRPEAIVLPKPNLYETCYIRDYNWDNVTREYKDNWDNAKIKFKKIVAVLGSCTKVWGDSDLAVTKKIGKITLIFRVGREAVCEKKLTGNKIIHAATTHYVPERIEEEFEWECNDVALLAD